MTSRLERAQLRLDYVRMRRKEETANQSVSGAVAQEIERVRKATQEASQAVLKQQKQLHSALQEIVEERKESSPFRAASQQSAALKERVGRLRSNRETLETQLQKVEAARDDQAARKQKAAESLALLLQQLQSEKTHPKRLLVEKIGQLAATLSAKE